MDLKLTYREYDRWFSLSRKLKRGTDPVNLSGQLVVSQRKSRKLYTFTTARSEQLYKFVNIRIEVLFDNYKGVLFLNRKRLSSKFSLHKKLLFDTEYSPSM